MNEAQKEALAKIKNLGAEEAVCWVLEKYSIENDDYGEVFGIIVHRSWPKREQMQLADYYLSKVPFSSERPYKAFLSFMSVKTFIGVLKKFVPDAAAERELLAYHLRPLLLPYSEAGNASVEVKNFIMDLQN